MKINHFQNIMKSALFNTFKLQILFIQSIGHRIANIRKHSKNANKTPDSLNNDNANKDDNYKNNKNEVQCQHFNTCIQNLPHFSF